MAGANLSITITAQDAASAVFGKVSQGASSLGSKLGSAFAGIGAAGLAIGGIATLGTTIAGVATSMISGNSQMETYQTQLGTLMGSADAASERIKQLTKIGAETPFELTELVSAEKVMMGFGLTNEKTMKLAGMSLDQYRTSMGDMAAGSGTDLTEMTTLWAKFGAGATGESISRLQELGIVTREQLQEVGIQFSKSGELTSPLPEALAAAMKIGNAKFGGGMKALSATFEGQMSTLADNFNQAKTVMMAPIFDVLKSGLTSVNELLSSEGFQDGLKSFAEGFAAAVKTAINGVTALLDIFQGGDAFDVASESLGTIFPPEVTDTILNAVAVIGDAWRTLLQVFSGDWSPSDQIDPIINAVGLLASAWKAVFEGDLTGALKLAGDAIEGFGGIIASAVEAWASAFADWVDGADTGMMSGLGGMLTGLLSWLQTSGLAIMSKLLVWAGAFVDWVAPKIPPLLAALGGLLADLLAWMVGTALPRMLSQLLTWGAAFVEWVAPRIGPLLAALGSLLVALGGWLIGTALPAIISQLLQWGDAFTAWVIPAAAALLVQLLILQGQLILWIAGQVPAIAAGLLEWAKAFVEWVATAVAELPGKLAGVLSAITGWISGAAGGIQAEAASIGAAIINGIANGISAGIGSIRSMAANAANSALEAAKSALGIESPSTVFRDQVGRMIPAGIVEGIDGMQGRLDASLSGLVQPQALRPIASPSYAVAGARGGSGGGITRADLDYLAASIARGVNATRPVNLIGTAEELARMVRRELAAEANDIGLLRGAR